MERWILVLRNTQSGQTRVWTNDDLRRVVARVMKYRSQRACMRRKACLAWSKRPDVDQWLKDNYAALGPRNAAVIVSQMMRRKVTKNAVVGRWRRLKKYAQLRANGIAVDQPASPVVDVDGKLDTNAPAGNGFADCLLTNTDLAREA